MLSRIPVEELRRGSLAALAAFVAGALAVAALLFWDAPVGAVGVNRDAWDDASEFLDNPESVVWLALLAAQGGLWAIVLAAARSALESTADGASRRVTVTGFVLIGLLLLPVVVVPIVTSPTASPLPLHRPKIVTLIVVAFVAAGPWIVTTWRIGTIARRLSARAEAGGSDWLADLGAGRHPFDGYLRLRELLGHAVTILGVVVAAITLTTGALRLAVLADDPAARFPISSVLVYGGFFSLLLTLIYLPVQLRLLELGRRLRDWAAPVAATDDWRGDAFKARGEAEALLQLTAGPVASVQAGLAILAPLATALVGVLLSAD